VIDGQYYIYFHRRPDTGEVFYVGKGKVGNKFNPTSRAKITKGRNKSWCSIVDKNSGEYSIEIVEWLNTNESASAREIFYITVFKRKTHGGSLVNQTDGGDGAVGYKHTAETKEKLKAAWASCPERKNHLFSESFKEARKKSASSRPGPMTGKKHSPETIKSYQSARSGSKNSQARRVVNTTTGEEFGCVGDAAKSIGLSQYTLYNYLLGNVKNTTTLEYK